MPVILVTQEAEIRRIAVWSQPRQIVHETLSQKNPSQNKRTGGVARGVGLEFKPQYHKQKEKCKVHLEVGMLTLSISEAQTVGKMW
jgi:hypothetical protein